MKRHCYSWIRRPRRVLGRMAPVLLILLSIVSCAPRFVPEEIVGRWTVSRAAGEILKLDDGTRRSALLEFRSDGRFAMVDMPNALLGSYESPNILLSGSGSWAIRDSSFGDQFGEIQLRFDPGSSSIVSETAVLVDRSAGRLQLFGWYDEEGGNRVALERTNATGPTEHLSLPKTPSKKE